MENLQQQLSLLVFNDKHTIPNFIANDLTLLHIIVTILCIVTATVFFSLITQRGGGRGSSSSSGSLFSSGPSRTQLVLCGPSGSGKTTLFQALIHPDQSAQDRKSTQMSMRVNSGWVAPMPASLRGRDNNENSNNNPNPSNKRFEVVDCPGHLRLFDMVLEAFQSAKVICIVVDGTKAQDAENGASSVATLLMTVLTAKETEGVTHVLIACNKRDQLSSFTSKALQKYVEKQLKQRLSQNRASATSAVGGVDATATASAGSLKKSETLSLDENGEFDWDSTPRPVSFCDISAKNPNGKFSLESLFELM